MTQSHLRLSRMGRWCWERTTKEKRVFPIGINCVNEGHIGESRWSGKKEFCLGDIVSTMSHFLLTTLEAPFLLVNIYFYCNINLIVILLIKLGFNFILSKFFYFYPLCCTTFRKLVGSYLYLYKTLSSFSSSFFTSKNLQPAAYCFKLLWVMISSFHVLSGFSYGFSPTGLLFLNIWDNVCWFTLCTCSCHYLFLLFIHFTTSSTGHFPYFFVPLLSFSALAVVQIKPFQLVFLWHTTFQNVLVLLSTLMCSSFHNIFFSDLVKCTT